MSDLDKNNIVGKTPLDKGKKTIEEIFEETKKQLTALTFISTFSCKNKPDEYLLPKQNKFLFQI